MRYQVIPHDADNAHVATNKGREEKMWNVEVTDTFGGEANYCWVNRYTVADSGRNSTVVRRAKKAAGWSGMRCSVSSCGDMIEVRPVGKRAPCWIMFITWND